MLKKANIFFGKHFDIQVLTHVSIWFKRCGHSERRAAESNSIIFFPRCYSVRKKKKKKLITIKRAKVIAYATYI